MKKRISLALSMCLLIFSLAGCSKDQAPNEVNNTSVKESTITVAAAASLKNCMDEKLIPMFQEKYPNIKVQGTYDGSGKLQTQIEEGAEIDVFISAAMKQMKALNEKGLIDEESINELLENKVVLIVPKGNNKDIKTFEDILKSDKIAIGDPASVPAGQYAKELFENLKIWDKVSEKTSLGTNVTEVLTWVAEGSADAGVVYSTDAASNDKVEVSSIAAEGSVSKVIYPVGIVKSTKEKDSAKKLTEFLASDEAIKVFESYGFSKK
ncbi:molybdate ABC transporter substrate-binding protein [Clostridium sp.]|uniref:molybdate ABC transporter substrate-binding protein n=1 Tax=Clostridium sp. TaxID=1506 RepID=UPI002635ABE8|nr:molybdate ABC transporter substrate-binding protein [Clostridium sp.]